MPIHKVYLCEETFGHGRTPLREKRSKLIHTGEVETEQKDREEKEKDKHKRLKRA